MDSNLDDDIRDLVAFGSDANARDGRCSVMQVSAE
jgi:hypothetical protein